MNISQTKKSPIKVLDLFCGAGLLGHAFAEMGFEIFYAVDQDADAVATYNAIAKAEVAKVADIRKIPGNIKCDMIIAGPPCQGFSTLGKRDDKDPRNDLSLEVARWAKATSPKMIVIENVPQFVKSRQYEHLTQKIVKMGYEFSHWLLDASKFGTPQYRKRSISIYSKIGMPDRPKEAGKTVTVADAFKGLTESEGEDCLHKPHKPTELALSRMRLIPPRGSKLDLLVKAPHLCPESWFALGKQAGDVWGRLDYNRPANTIKCGFLNPSKGRYIHPVKNRGVTLREGARLQGIPDNWPFVGSRASIAKQIGNGVPVPLGRAIAKTIQSHWMCSSA